jgi:TrmH family RNA methyltransferase
VVEGAKLLREACRAGAGIEAVYIDPVTASLDERDLAEACRSDGAPIVEVAPGVLSRVLDTVTPQPIAATVHRLDRPLSAAASPSLAVVLAGVGDPGNAGTLIRSAAAAGADLVVLCKPSVDLYNPKTVRASAGAMFHIPVIVDVSPDETLEHLARAGVKRWGSAAQGGVDYTEADLRSPCALIVGNEAHGIAEPTAGGLDGLLTIPMFDRTESLNVAVAGALLCFEAARQRRTSAPGRDSGRGASPITKGAA